MLPAPVIFPPIVRLAMLDPAVMLVSGVLMFCEFREFNPTTVRTETIVPEEGLIRIDCVLIASS
jgi:hypothetical protein